MPPSIAFFLVDAFVTNPGIPFTGNQAAVCLLFEPLPTDVMQKIANNFQLSETAFVQFFPDQIPELRWFTPTCEVDLCGHATLATAHALFLHQPERRSRPCIFRTKSGDLTAEHRGDDGIALNFPATPPREQELPSSLLSALGVSPAWTGQTPFDAFIVVSSEEEVRALRPDLKGVREAPYRGIIVTAPSRDPRFDCVSRFFAPAAGIDEDPATGSAHCALGPFWRERLGKDEIRAYQASTRGAAIVVRTASSDRVELIGHSVLFGRGRIEIPG